MEIDPSCDSDRTVRRQINEAMLARYPELSESELTALRTWFKKEATAYDMAMISSNANIASQFKGYRAKYIDPFSLRDLANFSLVMIVIVGFIAAIAYLGT